MTDDQLAAAISEALSLPSKSTPSVLNQFRACWLLYAVKDNHRWSAGE